MNIYEIDQQILNCIDSETGEVVDVEAFEILQVDRKTKIDNIACWYKQQLAEAEAIKEEEKALYNRRKTKESNAERLKAWLSETLSGEKFETSRNVIGWRKSESINILNQDAIEEVYKEHIDTVNIDKAAVKKAIKAGENVTGAELLTNQNIQIK